MLCPVCHRWCASSGVCGECRRMMRPATERILPGGVRVVAAFEHQGPARSLVHHLKYRGLVGYADLTAAVLAEFIPPLPLVPVPRAWSRRIRYGIDPAATLAARLSARTGAPVLNLLAAPFHAPRRAEGDHAAGVEGLRLRRPVKIEVIVVDDVVTTGATLLGAIGLLGSEWVRMAVTANAVTEVSSLRRRLPIALEERRYALSTDSR